MLTKNEWNRQQQTANNRKTPSCDDIINVSLMGNLRERLNLVCIQPSDKVEIKKCCFKNISFLLKSFCYIRLHYTRLFVSSFCIDLFKVWYYRSLAIRFIFAFVWVVPRHLFIILYKANRAALNEQKKERKSRKIILPMIQSLNGKMFTDYLQLKSALYR